MMYIYIYIYLFIYLFIRSYVLMKKCVNQAGFGLKIQNW